MAALRRTAVALAAAVLLAGCTPDGGPAPDGPSPSGLPTPSLPPPATFSPTPEPTPTPSDTPPAPEPTPTAQPTPSLDPDNEFWTEDDTWYTSDWFAGRGRIMIGFGCTEAPYYSPDPRCSDGNGFHHGIDVALPCGTDLLAGTAAEVVPPDSAGRLGGAYGDTAFRLRDAERGIDVVVGHPEQVFVTEGRQVRPGERIATVGDRGAPDGCHLHLEVRPTAGQVSAAVDPAEVLGLSA